ncbi:hypothetical protein AHAS_Ahas03G0391200 [Arachis hypogaea]
MQLMESRKRCQYDPWFKTCIGEDDACLMYLSSNYCSVSDLLDFISPELDSNGNEQAQRKQQILLPISEQNLQREDAPSNVGVVYNGLEYATGMAENKTKERSGMVDYEVMNENGNNVPMYSPPVSSESIHQEETSSDEGWQEANSKGRSRNTANHKLGRRGSHLSKLRTTVIRESPQKSSSRVLSKVLSPSRQSEPENLAFIEDSAGQLSPTKPTRVSKSSASLIPYDTRQQIQDSITNKIIDYQFNIISKYREKGIWKRENRGSDDAWTYQGRLGDEEDETSPSVAGEEEPREGREKLKRRR